MMDMHRAVCWGERHVRLWWAAAVSMLLLLVGNEILAPPWLRYESMPFKVMQPSVRAGEAIPLRVERCNRSDETRIYTIARGLLDDKDRYFVMPESSVRIAPGCQDIVSTANVVPEHTPPGRYVIVGLTRLNGVFRDRYIEWYSEPFDVEP